MIPLALHVDGAEFYSNSEYLCWSMSSILTGSDLHVFDTKYPMVILPHACLGNESVKAHVHACVAKVIGWSLRCASEGRAPTVGAFGEALRGARKDFGGQTLSGGWRATYFAFRFDEKARKEVNYFERSYQHSFICMRCVAQQCHKNWNPQLCYKNMHPSAAHRLAPISSLHWSYDHCS